MMKDHPDLFAEHKDSIYWMKDDDVKKYQTPKEMWPCFNGNIFRALCFIDATPIYFDYLREMLYIIANARVQHTDLRLVQGSGLNNDGTRLTND